MSDLLTTEQSAEVNALHLILNQQLAIYSQMEKSLRRKKTVLIDGDARELGQVDSALVSLAQQVTELEQRRMTCLTLMGFHDCSLGQVLEKLPAENSVLLSDVRDRLKKSLDNISQLSYEIKALLELSLDWVSQTVDLIAKSLTPEVGNSYNASGQKSSSVLKAMSQTVRPSTIQRNA